MTVAQFISQFDTVIEAFGGAKKFPMVVLERMHVKCQDLTPIEMKTMCELIIDSCDYAPKTVKVAEFANIARARHRTGTFEKRVDEKEFCSFCDDLGLIRAISTDESHETLMRCECSNDKDRSNWKLPKWDRMWAPLYRKEQCLLSWFKPERLIRDPKTGDMLFESFEEKRRLWREKVRRAEKFWIEKRTESETV